MFKFPRLVGAPTRVVLMDAYGNGFSFVIPFFPPKTRFFDMNHISAGFDEQIAYEVTHHHGPVLYMRRFGLREQHDCEDMRTGIDRCELGSVEPSSEPPRNISNGRS
jgi:hypothetical protein